MEKNQYEKAKSLCLPTQKINLNWPREIESICPVCIKPLTAKIYEKDNKIFMEKTCEKDGEFKECLSDDAIFFKRNELLTFEDDWGHEKPITKHVKCPTSCGICNQHIGTPCLVNIDLTNRCNMKCPVCFANSNAAGYVYEPNLEQVKTMIKAATALRPVPAPAIQYSGGEPTLSPIWFDALKMAKDLGVSHVQAASNGITFAKVPGFAKKSKEAGLDTVYLQFDGTDDEAYRYTRKISNLFHIKEKAIEEIGKAGMTVCLVATIVGGESSKYIGDIIKYAINHEYVTSVSLQPVSFTGRMDPEERKKMRFTLTDLARESEKQTNGMIKKYDWYPMSVVSPFSRLLDVLQPKKDGTRHLIAASHAHCGLASYLCVNKKTKEAVPFPRFLDIAGVASYVNDLAKKLENKSKIGKSLSALKALAGIKKYFIPENAPKGMKFRDLLKFLKVFFGEGDENREAYNKMPWRMIFLASMHFQDSYTFEVERIQRCSIYYCSPDGKIYPFCSYNVGPYFRDHVEKKFSVPIKEWVKNRTKEGVTQGFYEGKV